MSDTESSSAGCGVLVVIVLIVAAFFFGKCSPSDGDVIETSNGQNGRRGYCTAWIDDIVREEKIGWFKRGARRPAVYNACRAYAQERGASEVYGWEECIDRPQHPYCYCKSFVSVRCD